MLLPVLLLAIELLVLSLGPGLIFRKAKLFSPLTSDLLACFSGIVIYAALPDPINISFLDDVLAGIFLFFLIVFPYIRKFLQRQYTDLQ